MAVAYCGAPAAVPAAFSLSNVIAAVSNSVQASKNSATARLPSGDLRRGSRSANPAFTAANATSRPFR